MHGWYGIWPSAQLSISFFGLLNIYAFENLTWILNIMLWKRWLWLQNYGAATIPGSSKCVRFVPFYQNNPPKGRNFTVWLFLVYFLPNFRFDSIFWKFPWCFLFHRILWCEMGVRNLEIFFSQRKQGARPIRENKKKVASIPYKVGPSSSWSYEVIIWGNNLGYEVKLKLAFPS